MSSGGRRSGDASTVFETAEARPEKDRSVVVVVLVAIIVVIVAAVVGVVMVVVEVVAD